MLSLVPMVVQQVVDEPLLPLRQAAWQTIAVPPFSDRRACVRPQVWPSACVCLSTSPHRVVTIPRALCDRLMETLASTA